VRASSPALSGTNQIHLRDLWGTGKLALLRSESLGETTQVYLPLCLAPALGNPLAHRTYSTAYTSWPRLSDLLPFYSPGLTTSTDALVVDIDDERLADRMRNYFSKEVDQAQLAAIVPAATAKRKNFDAVRVRTQLQEKGFRRWQIRRYLYRPFDLRWIYWEPTEGLIDRERTPLMREVRADNRLLEARQSEAGDTFCRGTVSSSLPDHFGNGPSSFFPQREYTSHGGILQGITDELNLTRRAVEFLNSIRANGAALFPHCIAIMHTPQYRAENEGALICDWPQIPLPATADLLTHSANLGRHLAELLDAESSINLAAEWSFLAALKLPLDPNLDEALKLTAGWGHKGQGNTVMPGRGLAPERPWTDTERQKLAALAFAQSLTTEEALTLLGETCVDVYLNGNSHWSAVPIHVWNYTLGGYQVLKKWLSYREFSSDSASPLLHRPLHPEEAAYFAQVVRRIAAILLTGPALDASYRAILPTATGLLARQE
jgi:hypothetical protein